MMSKPNLSTDDIALFHSYIKDNEISPISQDKLALGQKLRKYKYFNHFRNKQYINDNLDLELSDCFESTAPDSKLFFARPGLQTPKIRKFRQGQFPIEKKLDLHGFTLAQAKTKLTNFLVKCQKDSIRNVLIVHGCGKHSPNNKALLKSAINTWLQQFSYTLAFASARQVDGGVGAVYLLLKKHEE
jgi:DNA-nicking Smr family endonuclease